MSKRKQFRSCALILIVFIAAGIASAQTCTNPSQATLDQAQSYIAKRLHLADPSALTLQTSKQVPAGCFWQLSYQINSGRVATYYLSPDGQFLTASLLDLRKDPLDAEKVQAGEVQKALAAPGHPTLGHKGSSIRIAEFSDFECPFCKRAHDLLQEELSEHPDEFELAFYNFPLEMHPWAEKAALLATCLHKQNPSYFWHFQDEVFAKQRQITATNFDEFADGIIAQKPDVEQASIQQCASGAEVQQSVAKDVDLGKKLGVHGTPTLFLNGRRMPSAKTAEELHAQIVAATSSASQVDMAASR